MTRAVVLWTNEAFHPRANVYKEGFRHCLVFLHSEDGWYGREFRPGLGEIILPHVAEPDDDLLRMLTGNSPRIDQKIGRRRANVLPAETKRLYQWRWSWYRNRCTHHVKWCLGIKAPQIRRPFHLYKMLEPVEETPKKARPVAAAAQLIMPAK